MTDRRAFLKSVVAVPAAALCGLSVRLTSAHVTAPLSVSLADYNQIALKLIMPAVRRQFMAESPFYHVARGVGPRG